MAKLLAFPQTIAVKSDKTKTNKVPVAELRIEELKTTGKTYYVLIASNRGYPSCISRGR
jgi:hypothetical protein